MWFSYISITIFATVETNRSNDKNSFEGPVMIIIILLNTCS